MYDNLRGNYVSMGLILLYSLPRVRKREELAPAFYIRLIRPRRLRVDLGRTGKKRALVTFVEKSERWRRTRCILTGGPLYRSDVNPMLAYISRR